MVKCCVYGEGEKGDRGGSRQMQLGRDRPFDQGLAVRFRATHVRWTASVLQSVFPLLGHAGVWGAGGVLATLGHAGMWDARRCFYH